MDLHVESTGEGPPLLMLHGWAMHGGIFRPLIEALSQRYRVHCVDLPGHGGSRDRGQQLALRDTAIDIAEAYPGAIWWGWSLGGLFALSAALERPRSPRALVLIAANPRFVSSPDWPHGVAHAVFDDFGRDLQRDWRATVDRFLALECIGSDCARAELRELRAHVFERGEPALHVLDEGLHLLADTDLRARLGEIAQPTLWIAGARDRLVPWAALQHAAGSMPNAAYVRIDGGGHAPFIGHPDRVLAAFESWSQRTLAA
jgi:pimeloyl-[acyl-carrier protein] methyl ester esterase